MDALSLRERVTADLAGAPDGGIGPVPSVRCTMAQIERWHIARAIEHHTGNITEVAAMLDMKVRTLKDKIAKYGLDDRARWKTERMARRLERKYG